MPLFSFDALGSAFLGIIVYFLVFLIAGNQPFGRNELPVCWNAADHAHPALELSAGIPWLRRA
jgi:hypothetical protein